MWQALDPDTLKSKRDRAILTALLGCALRRRELADLGFMHLQQWENHWAIVDLVGKGGHIRAVPMPEWVKSTVDAWIHAAKLSYGRLFRCVPSREVLGQRGNRAAGLARRGSTLPNWALPVSLCMI